MRSRGKLKKVRRKGTKHQQRRPESEWLTVSVPELRIVPEELWQRVKAQLEERAETFPRSRDGRKLIGRPRHQDESAYLLVGFTRCSMCGGPVGTETRRHGSGHWEQRRVVAHYACLDRQRRGKAVCSNAVVIPQAALDRAVLRAVIDALNPDVLLRAVEVALAKLAHAREKYATRRAEVEQETGSGGAAGEPAH